MPQGSVRSRALPAVLALSGVCLAGAGYVNARALQNTAPTNAPSVPTNDIRQTLNTYCVTCHNARLKTAGLQLDTLDVNQRRRSRGAVGKGRHETAHRRDAASGPAAARCRVLSRARGGTRTRARCGGGGQAASGPRSGSSLESQRVHQRHPRSARPGDRWTALLSSDEADQEGFDNVASVLSVSPALLENYLSAARTISRLAVGDLTLGP